MGVHRLKIEHFRCLNTVELQPGAGHNVIVGANGAGKTSILEALFYLGRGRSFRPGPVSTLIQTGSETATLFAETTTAGGPHRQGVEIGRSGSKIHVDGNHGATTADLVSAFPVQVIDSEVHQLVQGGPGERRQFIDWGMFHVKHEFLPVWRRYRRALQQRNRALRQGLASDAVSAWNPELISAGNEIDALRRAYLDGFAPEFSRVAKELIGLDFSHRYRSGWPREVSLADALADSHDRDANRGQTQVGPHRAELVLEVEEIAARHRLSRGQQKLCGIALVLAQSRYVAEQRDEEVTLLLDEPAAELDAERLAKLIDVLSNTRAQLFISALDREALPLESPTQVFHVEHGEVTTLL